MYAKYEFAVLNVRSKRIAPLIIALVSIVFANPAKATGTTAGTTITNTAEATYNVGGTTATIPSNPVALRVDELLDVTVASADPGDVPTTPAATNQVLTFNVTNTGNGSEAFRLAAINTVGGDDFDPTTTSIVLDTNNNLVYDAGTDIIYTPGSNDPVLAPDTLIRVFVLSAIPASTNDGNRGQTDLTATAVTGSGTPGTSFANQGQGGGDAVVGATSATGRDDGFYIVQSATVSFVKSATVLDPFNGGRTIPGSVITYTLVATISGSGTLNNLTAGDPVPANTTYVANTITLQGAPLTDGSDADAGEFAANKVTVRFGNVAGGQTRTITFKVRVN
jgi:uncharacterized repeat protein (TIGR01451 family)